MHKLFLLALLAFAQISLFAQNAAGTWQGTLKAGGRELRIAFKITRVDDETLCWSSIGQRNRRTIEAIVKIVTIEPREGMRPLRSAQTP